MIRDQKGLVSFGMSTASQAGRGLYRAWGKTFKEDARTC